MDGSAIDMQETVAKLIHPVPDAALEADIAILGKKGRGKSYCARGLIERLLDKGRQVIVLDPLSSWWGLKIRADRRPGYPIAVIGGPQAEINLQEGMGETLAQGLVAEKMSAVIDLGDMRKGELIRFCTDFLDELYRINRAPLWLVLEEADVLAPQQPMADATRLLHEVDRIARRGRARGFRLITLTQRPAKIAKDVLTQLSTLIALGVSSPQDRAAIQAWIEGNADKSRAREVTDTLASLRVGEGWVWAPEIDLLDRVKFPPIKTLDTSATPKAGEELAEELAKKAAKDADILPDISRLKARLKSLTENEESDDFEPAKNAAENAAKAAVLNRRLIEKAEHEGYLSWHTSETSRPRSPV